MDDEILTIKEVGKYLKVGERTAYRLAQDGVIPAFKVGGSWRVRKVDLEAWITRQLEARAGAEDPDTSSETPTQ